jgi:acetyltransferase
MTLEAIFEPKRIALVGASDQPGKMGSLLWENLRSFDGDVVPVTSSAPVVGGVRAYTSLAEVEGDIDLVVLAVPAPAVPDLAAEAAARGVRAMVVLSGGFAETGAEGRALQERLADAAGPVRVVGPNCFGVQNAARGLNASIAVGAGAESGGVALVTQSGAYGMAIHAMGSDEQLHFGKVFASGNKVDIDDAEVIEYLTHDGDTDVICLFAESVGDGRALARAVAIATPAKPVIVAKTGRSEAGSRAARSHTGSLATSDAVFRAAMTQAGAILASSGLEMLDVARVLSSRPLPNGSRVAVITNSGGTGVELVDMFADEGLTVPELSDGLQRAIAERLPAFASPVNPVDMTPVWSRFAELYPWLIETLARSGEVDVVVPILLQRSATDLSTIEAVAATVGILRDEGVPVPIYCCWVAPRAVRTNADVLQKAGVPCLEWPARTARAVGHAVRYAITRADVRPVEPMPPPSAAFSLTTGPAPAIVAAELLAEAGIETVDTVVCNNREQAIDAGRAIGERLVMKAGDPALAHRTEAGGVALGVEGDEAVAAAYDRLATLGPPVLVQPQLSGVEMAVGGFRDPSFGPIVMVGMGGTAVELLGDVAFALAPVAAGEAVAMVERLRGAELLAGFRGSDVVDVEALGRIVAGLGLLLCRHPELTEVDLNPVLVSRDRAVAVDWKLAAG